MRTLTYIFILLTFGITAQKLNLQFSFEDGMTNSSIDSVNLTLMTTSNQVLMSQWIQNNEVVVIGNQNNLMIKIKALKAGFYALDTIVNLNFHERGIRKENPIFISLTLQYDGQASGEYNIMATYKPEIAFSSEQISVSDFAVIDENTMVLLTYPKRLMAGSELIWYKNDSIISRKAVPEIAIRLDTDYRNRVYLRSEYTDYILSNDDFLSLTKIPSEDLGNYIRPILDTLLNEELYFTTHKSHYPAFNFFKVQLKDTSNKLLHHIVDTEMMEHYRAEYK